jgi:hypothetical protein
VSSRTLTAGVQTAIAQAQITPLMFVELDFASGFLRLTTAGHDVPWNGHTWTGVGLLGKVDAIGESAALEATGVKLTLSGIDSAIIAIALQEDYQGRPAKLWLAFVNDSGAIVADPLLVFVGRMDTMQVADGETATVVLNLENEFAAWDRPRVRRFTNADQQAEYPGDLGFEFVTEAAQSTVTWGYG